MGETVKDGENVDEFFKFLVHKVLPVSEQDKIKEGHIKTTDGKYYDIEHVAFFVDGRYVEVCKRLSSAEILDKIDQGLIRLERGRYVPISGIEKIREYPENISSCFVATAVYGDVNAPQVKALREFRDNFLMHTTLGRALVKLYYSGVGERIAHTVSEQLPSTIPAIRRGLDFLVNRYSTQRR